MEYDFDVEFAGICCHYKVDGDNCIVILVDGKKFPSGQHWPHVEVQYGGVADNGPKLEPLKVKGNYSYARDGVSYESYLLDGHSLSIASLDTALNTQPAFSFHTPRLTNVCPSFGDQNIKNFAKAGPACPAIAHFGYSGGTLDAPDSGWSEPTAFWPFEKDPPPPKKPGDSRELATVTNLRLRMSGDPVVQFTDFATGSATQLKLQSWVRKIRIGNMAFEGILGLIENDAKHFLLYYKMADRPDSMPIPVPPHLSADPEAGLGGGCSNTQYP